MHETQRSERLRRSKDTATRASLRRVGRIYQDQFATGAFSLVREARDKVGPSRVQDTLAKAAACHRGDAEVFEHDPIEPFDQLIGELVEESFRVLATWTTDPESAAPAAAVPSPRT